MSKFSLKEILVQKYLTESRRRKKTIPSYIFKSKKMVSFPMCNICENLRTNSTVF